MSDSAAVTQAARASPYKGLAPYGADDSSYFFGRERERDVVIANLRARHLTVVYGESGVGKSSLLHAGVQSELQRQARDDLEDRETPEFVPVVFSSWRDDPVTGLLAAVEGCVARLLPDHVLSETRDSDLTATLDAWAVDLNCEFLIILDQFEEYFLYHGHEEGDGTFDHEFPRALNDQQLRASFLLAIREDAFAKLDRFKTRVPGLLDNYLRIRHLDERCAREAIERPLDAWNGSVPESERVGIEEALVNAVLREVKSGLQGEQAGLGVIEQNGHASEDERVEAPYLQLVMTRLWDEETKEGSYTLRLKTLERLGGAERIVQNHLDDALGALPPAEQEVAAAVFYYLVTPEGTKIAQSVDTLAAYSGHSTADVERVLEKLATGTARIVRPIAPAPGVKGGTRYEIFHDVLASAILDWRGRIERVKLEEERAEAERRRAEAQEQARYQRRRAQAFRAAAIALGCVVIGGLIVLLIHQSRVAKRERAERQSRQLALNADANLHNDPELSLLLARKAMKTRDTREAEEALRESLLASHVRATYRGHRGSVNTAAFSPDGKLIATGSDDKTVRLWNVATGKSMKALTGHGSFVSGVAFSPNGRLLASASWDKTVRIWNVATGRSVRTLRGHAAGVQSAAFSPNGKLIVTASRDHTVRIWRVATGAPVAVLRGHTDRVNSAAFSPDGQHVVSASDDYTARIWNVSTRSPERVLSGHSDFVAAAAFSPDGRRVITASSDKTARIWDATSGRTVTTLRGHTDFLTGVAFSPDGTRAVTTSLDQTARVWDISHREAVLVLSGHAGPVLGAAFSPNGNFVVTASLDHTARLWSIPQRPLKFYVPGAESAAFSPDGKSIVAAGDDGSARILSVSERRTTALLKAGVRPLSDAVFSPDGRFVLTTGGGGIARLWNVASERVVRRFIAPTKRELRTGEFSADGRLVVTGGRDKNAYVFEAATGTRTTTLAGARDVVNEAAFSADGKRVATANADGGARVFDAATGKLSASLKESTVLRGQKPLYTTAFSPDGDLLVTAGAFGNIKLWNLKSRRATLLFGTPADVFSATFSPDGKLVLTAAVDGAVQLWDPATSRNVGSLEKRTTWIRSAVFSPSGKLVVTAVPLESSIEILRCEVCGSIDDLDRLAATRVTRDLTPAERDQYLGN